MSFYLVVFGYNIFGYNVERSCAQGVAQKLEPRLPTGVHVHPRSFLVKFRPSSTVLTAVRQEQVHTSLSTHKEDILQAAAPQAIMLPAQVFTTTMKGTCSIQAVHPAEHEVTSGLNRLFVVEFDSTAFAPFSIVTLQALLNALPDVEYAEPDYLRFVPKPVFVLHSESLESLFADEYRAWNTKPALPMLGTLTPPNDPFFRFQWYLQNTGQSVQGVTGKPGADINILPAWDLLATMPTQEIVVGVIDSGIPAPVNGVPVPDFNGRTAQGYNFITPTEQPFDTDGHGSNVSSLIGATGNNRSAVAGINWRCRLMPMKVVDSRGAARASAVVSAIRLATDLGAKVLNMSLGSESASQAELDVIRYAAARGVISVTAMGNEGTSAPSYPAAYSTMANTSVIAVGSVNSSDRRSAPFCQDTTGRNGSNFGNNIDFVAPGEWIAGIFRDGSIAVYCGTSQAAPIVTGIVALMLSARPNLSFRQMYDALRTGARDQVGLPAEDRAGWDEYYGWGRVDAYRSLLALGLTPTSVRANGTDKTLDKTHDKTDANINEISMSTAPNPVHETVGVRFTLPLSSTVHLELFDALGRIIIVPVEGRFSPGEHHVAFNVSTCSPGMYILRLYASGKTCVQRVVILP